MNHVLAQHEAIPDTYPEIDDIEESDAHSAAWYRIERYIAWRFSPREVVWRVDADGLEWVAPLAPVIEISAQAGSDPAYTPTAGPCGGWILDRGVTTITATVGAGPAPAAVIEAVRRYVRLMTTAQTMPVGATRFSSGTFTATVRREELNPAMAMVNSGAADLLRAYRSV